MSYFFYVILYNRGDKVIAKWRNDVKDFLNNKKDEENKEEIKINFKIEDSDKEIGIYMTRPDLIFGITFILSPDKELEGKNAIHPITKELLPILKGSNDKVGIPGHNDEDYEFALKNNLPIKQVIMPVNASLDDNRPREDKECSYRQNVVLVVKHPSLDKYLYIDYNKQAWKCFISGGIEEGETPKDAAIRELKEESGFTDIKNIRELPFKMANVFYAAHKGVNRYSTVTSFYIELNSDNQKQISEEELQEHTIKWALKDELYSILENGFTDQIWLTKQALNDIKAYTGNGKYINSDFLDGLEDQKEAILKATEYIVKNNLGEK